MHVRHQRHALIGACADGRSFKAPSSGNPPNQRLHLSMPLVAQFRAAAPTTEALFRNGFEQP